LRYLQVHPQRFPEPLIQSQTFSYISLDFTGKYDALRRLVFDVAALGGFFLFLGAGFVADEAESGERSRDSEMPMPAASRKSPRRSSSASIIVIVVMRATGFGLR
jgi:hypothetical protein